jgi:hypothetical protein
MAVTRTHFRFRIDVWTANGESIVGHVAGIEDYELVHAVHWLAHEHVALLELNKSNRGSPWTAISRSNRRSRVLMVGRPYRRITTVIHSALPAQNRSWFSAGTQAFPAVARKPH